MNKLTGLSAFFPAFNEEGNVERMVSALKAILSKIAEDYEIIVINDGSKDNTASIVKNYPVRLINSANEGLSAARNTGIAASSNDFIIPLDSDDFFFPRSLSGLLAMVSSEYDIFYGLMTCSGRVVKPYTGVIDRDVLLKENPIFSSSLFRKTAWEKKAR